MSDKPKILVKHSSIQINDYTPGDCPQIERQFSIWNKLYHRYEPKAIIYYKSTLYLPRGIDVSWVERCMCEQAVYDSNFDEIDEVKPIMIKYLPRDETQCKALQFMLGMDDYIYTRSRPQLSVNLNTGAGKTYVSVAMSSYLKQRTMVITSSINWLDQWRDCIIQYTDTSPDEIYTIAGNSTIKRLFNGRHDISNYKFLLCSHMTLKSYAKSNGYEALEKLLKSFKVGLKIYDEAHLYFDNILMIDSFSNTKKTIYLTATPARSNSDENRLYQLAFKNIPKIDLFNEEEDPHTKVISIHYNSQPTAEDISKCKNQYGFDRLNYVDYIITRPNLYKLIYIILDLCLPLNGKTLIYIGKIDAINYIYQWMINTFPFLENDISIYNSTVSKENKEIAKSKKIILTTTKSCGAAMDIQGLKCTVVLAEPIGSLVTTRQTLGRTRDNDTFYIDVVDNGFSVLRNYHTNKREVFNKYATGCVNISLSEYELNTRFENLRWKYMNMYSNYIQNLPKPQEMITVVTRINK